MAKLKTWLLTEDGSIIEYLVKVIILGLGSAGILFGILEVLRIKGGELSDSISRMGF
ncbi:MAG: hypothetical protein M1609_03325 [Firmicutes bacterium]|nr:hypothetical protein [Bacillota bacterium]